MILQTFVPQALVLQKVTTLTDYRSSLLRWLNLEAKAVKAYWSPRQKFFLHENDLKVSKQ